jgi:hypothetical protein
MSNDTIEKTVFANAKNIAQPFKIYLKGRDPIIGFFIRTADYSELKSKNFRRIVPRSNIEIFKKQKI